MLNKGRAQDTKTKIMEAAFELFGRFGYEGTSIREIAKKSEVNLAAMNYHFKSKENLFWEIMGLTHRDLEQQIQKFFESSQTIHELSMKTYDYFMAEKYALKNAMKMILAEDIGQPPEEIQKDLANPMGPPGGQYFALMIEKEAGYKLSHQGAFWGVKAIFGAIFHWSTMMCSDQICEKNDPLMSEEQIRKDVADMVESHMIYIKNNKQKFSV